MSQELRKNKSAERDIIYSSHSDGERKNYEGFEGMNYEQIRQPFNPKHVSRNRSNDKRNDLRRPDEG
jgi:hypothetical protein